jgi:hypothetical protein
MSSLIQLIRRSPDSAEASEILSAYRLVDHVEEPLEAGMEAERYLTSLDDGVQIRLDADGLICTIFLFSAGRDGFEQFQGVLPAGLCFDSRPFDVESELGAPSRSHGPDKTVLGSHGGWMRYDLPAYSLHFSFSASKGTIDFVTIMAADVVPR